MGDGIRVVAQQHVRRVGAIEPVGFLDQVAQAQHAQADLEGIVLVGARHVHVRAARGGSREILGKKLDSPLWRVYPQVSSGHFYAQNFDNVRRLVAFRKIRGLPLVGAVAFSENELMAPFAGARIHEETERAAALLALVDAARRRSEG